MILFHHKADLRAALAKIRATNPRIGFVPTMGALHEGHIALLKQSKQVNEVTVSSIFINPTQFNDQQDFVKYPVTLDKDIYQLAKAGCDMLFLPSVQEIYPNGLLALEQYPLGRLETLLEGYYRPGHFQGVCQVVNRLLDAVEPDTLFLGQKDYQQCMVIAQMLEITGKQLQLIKVPTLREPDGLAMSSRNMRLDPVARKNATAIYRVLHDIQSGMQPGKTALLIQSASEQLFSAGFEVVDYVSIADAATLEPIEVWDGATPCVALIAAFIGGVRLIDNMWLYP
jgi:pantoate--beta-alanine ligase